MKQQKLLSADLEPNFIQVEAKWSPSSAKLGHLRGYFGLLEAILGHLGASRTPSFGAVMLSEQRLMRSLDLIEGW